jgi:glycosyltransferase involved in cell wall biosynthesis
MYVEGKTLMKKVLIIAYDFPPRGGGGVIRITKFVKYLPQFGWQPYVITVKNKNPLLKDDKLVEEIPSIAKVFRLSTLMPDVFLKKYRSTILSAKLDSSVGKSDQNLAKKIIKKLYSFFEQAFIIPDNKISWIPLAIFKGYQLVKKEKIDVIFSTSPPHSTQIIGFVLKKLTDKPWCEDYRDEWVGNPYFTPKFRFRMRIEQFLESLFLNNSDYIIVNTNNSKKNFLKRYQNNIKKRFFTITNGYDPNDFLNIDSVIKKEDKFILSYIGSISIKRKPTIFFSALSKLLLEKPELKNNLAVNFIGPFYDAHREQIKQFRLSLIVNIVGNVTHPESINYMVNSDALLLLLFPDEATEGIIPGKTYEYLKANKPILALVPKGATADLIAEDNLSEVGDPVDELSVKDAIWQLYKNRHKKHRLYSSIDKFNRKFLTSQLANKLDLIMKKTC